MNAEEKLAYLRNIATIARADDIIRPAERHWFNNLCDALDVAEEEWDEVLTGPLDGDIDLRPIRRLSTQVRCLEDMVEVSLSDGHMDDSEKQLLFNAAREVGISNHQVLRILDEAAQRLHDSDHQP